MSKRGRVPNVPNPAPIGEPMRKTKIKQIAEIESGYRFRGRVRDLPTGDFKLIQIRDFDDSRRLTTESMVRIEPGRNPGPSAARENDVIFLSRGHNLWATVLPSLGDKAIISGYFFIVRPDPQVLSPAYLAWYLNHTTFQRRLRERVRGTGIPMISLGDFREQEIEVPPLELQERVVALDELVRSEQDLTKQLLDRRATLASMACITAIHGLRDRKGI